MICRISSIFIILPTFLVADRTPGNTFQAIPMKQNIPEIQELETIADFFGIENLGVPSGQHSWTYRVSCMIYDIEEFRRFHLPVLCTCIQLQTFTGILSRCAPSASQTERNPCTIHDVRLTFTEPFILCTVMLSKPTTRETSAVFSRIALSDQVLQLVTERILDQVYAPGERLNIDALSREFNVSSSPIREALTRLSALGLVSSSPFAVAPMPGHDWFRQLLEYRIVVESWAARQVARARPAEALEKMTASLRAMERGALGQRASDYFTASNKTDQSFHAAMLAGAGNEVLAQAVHNLHPHLHHARLFAEIPQDITPVIEEHRQILSAIVDGDEDAAAQAVERHLRASWKRCEPFWANNKKA